MNRFFFLLSVLLFSTLLGVFFSSSSVSASSVYDNIVHDQVFGGDLVIEDSVAGTAHYRYTPQEFKNLISQLIDTNGFSNPICADPLNSFLNDDATYYIVQNNYSGAGSSDSQYSINLYIKTGNFSPRNVWNSPTDQPPNGGLLTNNANFLYNFQYGQLIDSNTKISCQGSYDNPFYWTALYMYKPNGVWSDVLQYTNSTDPIEYPVNYEGDPLPGSIPTPIIQSEWSPIFYASIAKDYIVTLHDTNFNTFDKPAFLCDGQFAPILNYEIWDRGSIDTQGDETLLHSGFQSATMQIEYQLPKVNSEKFYRIIGWYSGCDDRNFTESDFLDFKISKYGTLDQTTFADCMKPEFPFFDLPACIYNFETIVSMLSFNQLELGNPWRIDFQCRTLSTIDSWLGLGHTTLCPLFPQYVRNVITPFVTFLLGLLSIQFISRIRREGH